MEGLPPPRSAVLVGQTMAAVQSSGTEAIKSVSCVVYTAVQGSCASIAVLPYASTTSGKLLNPVESDLTSWHM